MKPQEIIYHNEYSGLTEVCSADDINRCHHIGIKGDLIRPKDAAMKLLISKELRFVIYDNAINMQDFLLGRPRMSKGNKLYEAVFSLKNITDQAILAEFKEVQEGALSMPCGKIEWKLKKDTLINDIKGNAVIRIFDVGYMLPTTEGNFLLGNVALGLGLYFFVDLDGKWSKIQNAENLIDTAFDAQTKQLKDAITESTATLLRGQADLMSHQMTISQSMEQGFSAVQSNLKAIEQKLDDISSAIKVYKSDVDIKLKQSDSEEEAENIIEDFSNRLSERILALIDKHDNSTNYERNEAYLKSLFGDHWAKLNSKSKQFLITAKVLFSYMNSMQNEGFDYSGVCILVTKAVEEEMKRRFYIEFMAYLEDILPNRIEEWHYCMRKESKKNIYIPTNESQFTLGSISYICCQYKPKFLDSQIYENSKKQIVDFSAERLLITDDKEESRQILKTIARDVNDIKDRYRNPAAHINVINRITAEQCLNEVIDVQKILIKILSFMKG